MKHKIFSLLLIGTLLITSMIVCAQDDDEDEDLPQKPIASKALLIGYWQNFKNTATTAMRLSEIPRGYSIVNVAFASVSPEGNVKFTVQGPSYRAMANADALFRDDMKYLQRKGVKVLLSLGGMNSFFHVDNDKKVKDFVTSLEKIINDYGFNGIDFDFEGELSKSARFYLLAATRTMSRDFANQNTPIIFTIAPESIDVNWQSSDGKYNALINSGLIKYVAVQLYNSGCKRSIKANSPCYAPGTEDYIVSQVDSTIQTWLKRGIKDAESKYVIGLAATKRAANKGYTEPEIVNKALNCLKTGTDCGTYQPIQLYPNIGGVMTWSINWDAKNNYSFVNSIDQSGHSTDDDE